jgi:Fe-S cluster biosynthesis and repair protein YggX
MTRTVFCRKYQTELPGLASPPNPTPKGKALFEEVSQRAWDEWMVHQTRLINEKRLSLLDPSHRKYLAEQLEKFLSNEAIDQAEGYVPVEAPKAP